MGMWDRLKLIGKARFSKALDKAEDPNITLDYAYEQQAAQLTLMRQGVAQVATARKRIESQARRLSAEVEKLDSQATQAMRVGREDLAREALALKHGLMAEAEEMSAEYRQIMEREENAKRALLAATRAVDRFRTQKEVKKARYNSARAQAELSETFTGIAGDFGAGTALAVQRVDEKIEQLEARTAAIAELTDSGAFTDLTAPPQDRIKAELVKIAATNAVEDDLTAIKARVAGELPKGDAKALDGHVESDAAAVDS